MEVLQHYVRDVDVGAGRVDPTLLWYAVAGAVLLVQQRSYSQINAVLCGKSELVCVLWKVRVGRTRTFRFVLCGKSELEKLGLGQDQVVELAVLRAVEEIVVAAEIASSWEIGAVWETFSGMMFCRWRNPRRPNQSTTNQSR